MKIFVMPADDHAGCLLYSFAMILDTEPDVLIEELGHDGMKVIWPELSKPYCYQGYHIQEMLDCCLSRGKVIFPVEGMPTSLPPPMSYIHLLVHNVGPHMPLEAAVCSERFKQITKDRQGVLIGETEKRVAHAWAWDGERAHDPRATMGTARLGDLRIREAWLISKSH